MGKSPVGALPRHLPALDSLRAVAAIAVVVCHAVRASTAWSPAWRASHSPQLAALLERWMGGLGAWGVGFFFVLSGLCIHLPQARKLSQGEVASVELGPYVQRRFRRIYPPHLVALALSAALAFALPLKLFGVEPMISVPTWRQAIAHLLLVHTFSTATFYSVNHVFWSIAVEAHFYLLFPLLLLARRRVSMRWLCLALVVVSVALRLAGKFVLDEPGKWILAESFLCRFWEWVLGCCVAEFLARGDALPLRRPRVMAVAAMIAALAGGIALLAVPYGALWRSLLMPPLFALALAACAREAGGRDSALVQIGRASYSMYLVHPIAISCCLVAARALHFPWQAELALSALGTWALTRAFFQRIERPFLAQSAPIAQNLGATA